MSESETLAAGILGNAWRPPSNLSAWQWAEKHVELDNTSSLPGKLSFDLFPCSKYFLECAQNRRTRRITVMVSAQSAKTLNSIIMLMWRVAEKPIPTMWIMASADHCEEFAKKRLYPAMRDCPPVLVLSPLERGLWTKKLVMFDSMPLILRGSNSRIGLQSDPIGLIICDERREWKPGAIELVRKRLSTFHDSMEVGMGTAGVKDDELHNDFISGSQTLFEFICPSCDHSQPFRFGRAADTIWPRPREFGGIVWDENEKTKPGGQWDIDAVKKTVRYECEQPGCRRHFLPAEKYALLKTLHPVHRNPAAFPVHISVNWNSMIMPWPDCDWPELAAEFLRAMSAIKRGDPESLRSFVTESLGCPWEERVQRAENADILERTGTYLLGQAWPDDRLTVTVLTLDRQQLYLVYVIRQWRKTGDSRLVECGSIASYDDLRALQVARRIKDRCVWGDDGGRDTARWRQTAARYGWNVLKGEDAKAYTIQSREGNFYQGWRRSEADPGIGTIHQGRATIPVFLWARPWMLDKLYNLFIPGLGPLWEIPQDIPVEYLSQLKSNELREKRHADGSVDTYWHTTGADHFADCELMQIVVADIGGITRKLPAAQKPIAAAA